MGIGRLIAMAMQDENDAPAVVRAAQAFVDSEGLLHQGRRITDPPNNW